MSDLVRRDAVLRQVCGQMCGCSPEECELLGGPESCGDYMGFLRIPAVRRKIFYKDGDYICPYCGASLKGDIENGS